MCWIILGHTVLYTLPYTDNPKVLKFQSLIICLNKINKLSLLHFWYIINEKMLNLIKTIYLVVAGYLYQICLAPTDYSRNLCCRYFLIHQVYQTHKKSMTKSIKVKLKQLNIDNIEYLHILREKKIFRNLGKQLMTTVTQLNNFKTRYNQYRNDTTFILHYCNTYLTYYMQFNCPWNYHIQNIKSQ